MHLSGKLNVSAPKLPFPLCPGEFWADALKAIYGPGHVLLGFAPNPKFTDGAGEKIDVGPILSGLIFQIGVGSSKQDGKLPNIQVKLNLMDLKMINLTGSVAIEYDTQKPGEDCTLVTLDPSKIFKKFLEFANPLNWPSLASEFTKNPLEFYTRNIEIFYPAGVNLSLNVNGTIGGIGAGIAQIIGNRALVNKEPIWICCGNTPTFPPSNIGFNPKEPVVLVDRNNGEKKATIEEIETIWAHVFVDEKICQGIVASALTFDFIRDEVNKYFKPPKPEESETN